MASFVVDITAVRFAAANTGYKDITITGMPAAGVNCSITGTDSSSFGYRIPGSDQNVYRVYTTAHSSVGGASTAKKTATFKITNLGNSSDYVEVSLEQVAYWGYARVVAVSTTYANIYPYYLGEGFGSADIYCEYTGATGSVCEMLVDGYVSTTTSVDWIYYTAQTTYTDTGFKRVLVGCNNNYDAARKGTISFSSNGNSNGVYQNGYPSSTSGCTSPISFTAAGGTERVTLHYSSQNVANLYGYWRGDISGTYTKTGSGNSTSYWDLTVPANTSTDAKRGVIYFQRDATYTFLGFTIINQDGTSGPTPTLSVDPAVLTYPSTGGARVLGVTYAAPLTTNESSMPSWLSSSYVQISSGERSYTITAAANSSSSSRDWDFEFTDANNYVSVPLTQEAGEPASLSISPTSGTKTSAGGSVSIQVSYSGISEINYMISGNWITYSSKSGTYYYFNCAANTSTSQRQGTITFYGGGLSQTYTLTQDAAQTASMSVSPTSISFTGTGSDTQIISLHHIDDNWTYTVSGYDRYNDLFFEKIDTTSGTTTYRVRCSYNTSNYSNSWTVTFTSNSGYGSCTLTVNRGGIGSGYNWYLNPKRTTKSGGSGEFLIQVLDLPDPMDVYNLTVVPSVSWLTYEGINANGYIRISYRANTTGEDRQGFIAVTYNGTTAYVEVNQSGADTASIVLSDTSKTVSSSSGQTYVNVTTSDVTNLTYSISDTSWLHYSSVNNGVYTFSYDANTGAARSSIVTFSAISEISGNIVRSTFTVNQEANSGPSLSVSPSVVNVSRSAGTTSTTVTVNNPGTGSVSRSISGNWLTYTSTSGNTYNFSYSQNTGSGSRTATVTFSYPGATSVTFTVNQAGTAPVPTTSPALVAYPKTLKFKCEGGTIVEGFKKYPTAGVSYTTTYTDGSGWLSVTASGDTMAVTASANTGSRRRATIRFYETGNSGNYVDVPVIQGSTNYYESIWMDVEYRPSDWNISNQRNYYYGLLDRETNSIFFRGIAAIPEGWGGVTAGCIDIPRIVEDYIGCGFTPSLNNWTMLFGSIVVDFYNLNVNPAVVVDTFKYWNDWSRFVERYDYTRYLNDPINGKGCTGMAIPVCVYYDDAATFRIVDNETSGSVETYTLPTPANPFVQMWSNYYGTDRLDFKQDNDIIFSYDLRHCGKGAFIYKNRFGGYDSFLIEGNIIKTDNYEKLNLSRNGLYNSGRSLMSVHYLDEKYTDTVNINTTYEVHTGWLSDEESERLAFHLLSSPEVYFQDLDWDRFDYNDRPLKFDRIRLTNSSAEYKKFRNGRQLVKYTITFEMSDIQRVRN